MNHTPTIDRIIHNIFCIYCRKDLPYSISQTQDFHPDCKQAITSYQTQVIHFIKHTFGSHAKFFEFSLFIQRRVIYREAFFDADVNFDDSTPQDFYTFDDLVQNLGWCSPYDNYDCPHPDLEHFADSKGIEDYTDPIIEKYVKDTFKIHYLYNTKRYDLSNLQKLLTTLLHDFKNYDKLMGSNQDKTAEAKYPSNFKAHHNGSTWIEFSDSEGCVCH